MSFLCPKGHDSTDSDYCSDCGARIGATAVSVPEPVAVANTSAGDCPDCSTPREGGARFCAVCRYDFANKISATPRNLVLDAPDIPAPATPVAVVADASAVSAPVANIISEPVVSSAYQRLQAVITADITLVKDEDPADPFPVGTPIRQFPLDLEENLVGRFSTSKDSHPEIPVVDSGVSRRHLKFMRQADGSFSVLELGSSNGTLLNDAVLEPGVLTKLNAGDALVLGRWTRITIETR